MRRMTASRSRLGSFCKSRKRSRSGRSRSGSAVASRMLDSPRRSTSVSGERDERLRVGQGLAAFVARDLNELDADSVGELALGESASGP